MEIKFVRILAFFLHRYSEYGNMVSGADRRFLELSRWLKNLEVDVFALEYAPSFARSLKDHGYYPVEVSQRFRSHPILNILPIMVYGIRLCIRHKIDVVYSVDDVLTENVVTSFLVSRICRKPLAIVFHHIRSIDRSPFGFFRKRSAEQVNPLFWFIIAFCASLKRFIYRRAEVCLAVSRATAKDIKKTFGLKCVVIAGNGIDLRRYKRVKSQPRLFEAAYLGRVTSDKGVDILLKSWKIVMAKLPSAKLIIVGGFEKDWLKFHKKIVEELDLESNVIMTGFLPDDEVIRLLKSSKIFVLPSIEEGFGLTVLEAMACGLPCVLSDIPALKENFNSTAIFVTPKDPSRLASSIIPLLSNPKKLSHLRKLGLNTVKKFKWKRVAQRELKALKDARAGLCFPSSQEPTGN